MTLNPPSKIGVLLPTVSKIPHFLQKDKSVAYVNLIMFETILF